MRVDNVTAAKPSIGGGVLHAPFGTSLPESASATLNSAFADLGYISTDGVKNTGEITSEDIKAWGGDIVLTPETGKSDKFIVKFIEATNDEVLKVVHGSENVSGTLATGIMVRVNSKEHVEESFVIDTILRNNAVKRIVIPKGKVVAVGEVQYVDNNLVAYEVTISAAPHDTWDGDTHREYIIAASSGTSSGTSSGGSSGESAGEST